MRLQNKILIAMAVILVGLAGSFYVVVGQRVERREVAGVLRQLLAWNETFRSFRASEARLLEAIGRTVAEDPTLKSMLDDFLTYAEDGGGGLPGVGPEVSRDEALAALIQYFVEGTADVVEQAKADLVLWADGAGRVLTRITRHEAQIEGGGTESRYVYERVPLPSEYADSRQRDAPPGEEVDLRLQIDTGDEEGTLGTGRIETLHHTQGDLVLVDELGSPLPVTEQERADRSLPSVSFFRKAVATGGGSGRREAPRSGDTYWVFRDAIYHLVYTPIKHSGGTVGGALALGFRLRRSDAEHLAQLVGGGAGGPEAVSPSSAYGSGPGPAGAILFIKDETILVSSMPETTLRRVSLDLMDEVQEMGRRRDTGKAAITELGMAGERFLTLTDRLGDSGCNYYLLLSVSAALEPLRRLQEYLLFITLLGALIALLLSFLMARGITRTLSVLSTAMASVMKGDYTLRVPSASKDEVGQLATAFNEMVEGLAEREQYKRMVSRSAVERIQSSLKEGGGSREEVRRGEVTVLFSDIRSFTTLSEAMAPDAVIQMLNEYFTEMNDIILANGGDIDKFIGDAIMATFKGTAARNSAELAVRTAVQMQAEMKHFNARRRREDKPELQIGVGLNTGVVVEGYVGTENRFEHTVLGDTVNVASRLEGECKKGKYLKIVISQSTYDMVSDIVEVEGMGSVLLKGKTAPISIYEVVRLARADEILQDLASQDPPTRLRAARTLATVGEGQEMDRVLELLADPDREVRKGLVEMLGQPGLSSAARSVLVERLKLEEDEEIRLLVLASLGRVGDTKTLAFLEGRLSCESRAERLGVIRAIGELAGAAAGSLLEPLLLDPDSDVASEAALILFQVGRRDGLARLEEWLQSPDPARRTSAARRLGEIGRILWEKKTLATRHQEGGQEELTAQQQIDRVCEKLLAGLVDPDSGVQRAAVEALTRARQRMAVPSLLALATEQPDTPLGRAARQAVDQLI